MKVQHNIRHEGTLDNDRVRMTFDENSITHLQSLLIGMYADPEMAVYREYSTNALDSHRAAGQTRPVEVTLPTSFDPTFIVKDYGTGMSIHTITEQFSRYGWSSKRDTDEQVGMLGLGCKSGLAYTSQFSLVSIHEGVKATVLVTRETDGGAALQIVDTCSTDESNGVEIRIPIKNVISFNQKAERFFRFWNTGDVIVNGEPVTSVFDEPGVLTLDPDVVVMTGPRPNNDDIIVMGGVPYPVPSTLSLYPDRRTHGQYRMHFVVRVPIGAVKPAPSREALELNRLTRDTLITARQFIEARLKVVIKDTLNECKTPYEAHVLATNLRESFGGQDTLYEWRGHTIPSVYTRFLRTGLQFYSKSRNWDRRDAADKFRNGIRYGDFMDKSLIVTGYGGNSLPASTKAKIRKYYADNINQDIYFIYVVPDTDLPSPWLDNVPSVPFTTIQKIVAGDPSLPRIRLLKYRTLTGMGTLWDHATLPDNVVAWVPAGTNTQVSDKILYAARSLSDNANVLSVLKSQEKKFQKDHPNIPMWWDFAVAWLNEHEPKINDATAYVLTVGYLGNSSWQTATAQFGKDAIDPLVRKYVDLYRSVDLMIASQWPQIAETISYGPVDWTLPSFKERANRVENVISAMQKKYSLLAHVSSRFGRPDKRLILQYFDAIHMHTEMLHLAPQTY